jgi:hypothetical protein
LDSRAGQRSFHFPDLSEINRAARKLAKKTATHTSPILNARCASFNLQASGEHSKPVAQASACGVSSLQGQTSQAEAYATNFSNASASRDGSIATPSLCRIICLK